jgi:hypothetical protein
MRVGEQARVIALNRPTHEDRSEWQGKEGLLMRRLNAPWTPDFGALWEVRFDKENTVVFSESELAVVKPDGRVVSSGIEDVREDWGEAPRVPSVPFRRFGSASGTAPAVLALFVFLVAGVLLLIAGVADKSWLLGGAGGLLVLIGIGAAGVLIT